MRRKGPAGWITEMLQNCTLHQLCVSEVSAPAPGLLQQVVKAIEAAEEQLQRFGPGTWLSSGC